MSHIVRKNHRTAKAAVQSREHTLAAVLGRSNPNARPVTLAPINLLTLDQIEAKYGPIQSMRRNEQ